jgi:hypothetical protein
MNKKPFRKDAVLGYLKIDVDTLLMSERNENGTLTFAFPKPKIINPDAVDSISLILSPISAKSDTGHLTVVFKLNYIYIDSGLGLEGQARPLISQMQTDISSMSSLAALSRDLTMPLSRASDALGKFMAVAGAIAEVLITI